jgi:hypothetical protein
MASLNSTEFEQQILAICANSKIAKSVAQIQSGVHWVALRIYLDDDLFIDVFYNEETDKKSFALVRAGMRIFAADNAKKKWHWHPFKDPQSHSLVDDEILFSDFIRQVEIYLSKK